MKPTPPVIQDRINLRLRRQVKERLERAASFEGKTLSSFILSSAVARAEQTIQHHESIALNAQESQAFIQALTQPVTFNNALTAALKDHDQTVTSL